MTNEKNKIKEDGTENVWNELLGHDIMSIVEGETKGRHILKFTAKWCVPCKELTEILEKAKLWDTHKDVKWHYIDIDEEENKEITANLGIEGVPFMAAIEDGDVLGVLGGMSEDAAVKLDRILSGKCGACGAYAPKETTEKVSLEDLVRGVRHVASSMDMFRVQKDFKEHHELEEDEELPSLDCDVEIVGAYGNEGHLQVVVWVSRYGWEGDLDDGKVYEYLEDHVYEMLCGKVPGLERYQDVELNIWADGMDGNISPQ